MSLAKPSKIVAVAGYKFFYDRYALAASGFKLIGMQMRSDGRGSTGYVFSRGGYVFLGTHVMHQVLHAEAFYAAMEQYAESGILVPREIADIELAMAKTYHAYQLVGRQVALRTLLGPLRHRMLGPWMDVILAKQAEDDRKLWSVWQNVSRAFRNDPVAKANAPQRLTLPMWFAAYWVDRTSATRLTLERVRRPPGKGRVPKLPKRFRV